MNRVCASLRLTSIAALVAGCAATDAAYDAPTAGTASALTGATVVSSTAQAAVVAASTLRLTFSPAAVVRSGAQGAELVFTARSNRALESVFSWVPDDAFGEATLTGETSFEVVLRAGHELNSILSGLPLFVDVTTKTGAETNFHARLDLAASFRRASGARSIFVASELIPVYVDDGPNPLRYRGAATIPSGSRLAIGTDGEAPVITSSGARASFDFSYAGLAATLDETGERVTFSAGGAKKSAVVSVRLARLALTTEDAIATWPEGVCSATTRACIAAKPASERDFGDCGSYREVSACADAVACRVSAASAGVLPAAADAFNAACAAGDGFCGVTDARAFGLGASCADRSTTGVAEALAAQTALDFRTFEPSAGVDVTTEQMPSDAFFAGASGEALLAAVVATGGDGYFTAKKIVVETPCPNCHTFLVRFVFVFPSTGRVVTVDGRYGYDS